MGQIKKKEIKKENVPFEIIKRNGEGFIQFNLLAPELFFFNFSTPCTQNVNNTGTKYVRIMKQTAFLREKKESVYHV